VPGVSGASTEIWPQLTSNELTMVYAAWSSPISGLGDLFVASRSSVAAAFPAGTPIAQVNSTDDDGDPFLWRDGEALYFVSRSRAGGLGGYDIFVSTRRSDGAYGTPQPVSELNTSSNDNRPFLTPDGLTIYWSYDRPDGGIAGRSIIWRATRASTSAPFSNLAPVVELNSGYNDRPDWISPDQCKIYLTSTRPGGPGGQDIWEASRPAPGVPNVTAEYPVPTPTCEPFGIAAGPDGNVWFTEYSSGKIGRVTPAGAITEFPTNAPGAVPGIAAGADGNLWFTEGDANKIGRITPAGVITEFPVGTTGSFPYEITPGPDGNLWFTENYGNRIGRISTSGVITDFPVPTASSQLLGIVAGSDGNLWFVEYAGQKIGRITTAGVITEFQAGGNPWGITAGPDGNLWFTEEVGNRIGRITTAGTIVEYPIPTTALTGPWGITSGPDGNLWFSGNSAIGRVTPSGTFTELTLPSAAAAARPAHIASGADGNVWFAEEVGNRIGRLTP